MSTQTSNEDAGCCDNCGSRIAQLVARVLGDNSGNIPRCSRCIKQPNGEDFRSDAAAAMNWMAEGQAEPQGDVR